MNILLIGGGGRESAIAWKLRQSPRLSNLYIAPGNGGTATLGQNVALDPNDHASVCDFIVSNAIDMVVVGPEEPLVKGLHDAILADSRTANVPVIGPKAQGAELEGSKDFAKAFMVRHGIPTARYKSFTSANVAEGEAFLEELRPPYVLKADGLAAGKGVLIIDNLDEAKRELRAMLDGMFGAASATVVIEEFLSGVELSVFVLTDGDGYVILPEAKDYKRIGDNDEGLNTGGMGAVSPVPFADADFMKKVEERIVRPTVEGLKKDGIPYRGFIFLGLIKCGDEPMVIEYNVRMGDPETEVVMPRLKSDLIDLLEAAAQGRLREMKAETDPRTCTTVMMVSGGYPGAYEKGKTMNGLGDVDGNSIAFHAGTKEDGKGGIVTSGGRVIAVSSLGDSIEDALAKSYANVRRISFDGAFYRKDIGQDMIRIRDSRK
ncbi:MAG: phosphoribosylamine--glycine ligase [Bacteroidales bacterium]|nr:phosphoribosylamine--glycine ligase [Bacteroidales bacterium]MDY4173701.1 phosphoribosylamine--glycine ligase [Bacteroidales bacterium]